MLYDIENTELPIATQSTCPCWEKPATGTSELSWLPDIVGQAVISYNRLGRSLVAQEKLELIRSKDQSLMRRETEIVVYLYS